MADRARNEARGPGALRRQADLNRWIREPDLFGPVCTTVMLRARYMPGKLLCQLSYRPKTRGTRTPDLPITSGNRNMPARNGITVQQRRRSGIGVSFASRPSILVHFSKRRTAILAE